MENGEILDSEKPGNSKGRVQITPRQTVSRATRTPTRITLYTDRSGMKQEVDFNLITPANARIGAVRIVQPANFRVSGFEIIRNAENTFKIGFENGIAPELPRNNKGIIPPLPARYDLKVELWPEGTSPGVGNIIGRHTVVTVRVNMR